MQTSLDITVLADIDVAPGSIVEVPIGGIRWIGGHERVELRSP